MNIAGLCRRDVVTARRTDELTTAARLMREKHVGYLIVAETDPNDGMTRPVGVLTDRDIVVTVVAGEADPRALRVGDVMTENPVVVLESELAEAALQKMREIGVRRLPVVGSLGELVGVLTFDDIFDAIAVELQNLAGSIRNEQRIESKLRP